MSKGKVIPVDIFDDKCVIQEENEANHILTTSKYFLISTVDGTIKGLTLSKPYEVQFELKCKNNKILDLQYMESLDIIFTIEKIDEKSDINIVRMYHSFTDNVVINEIPSPRSVTCMAVSKNSNQIIISTSQTISLYNISNDRFIGSWVFDMAVPNVTKVAFCNNYISYVHDCEIYVIYFNISKPKKEEMNLTTLCEKTLIEKAENKAYDKIRRFVQERSSFLSTSSNVKKVPLNTPKEDKYYTNIEFNENNEAISVPSADLSPNFHSMKPTEEFLGPIRDTHRIQINVFEGYVLETSSILLYKKLETPIHSLSFYLPEKHRDDEKVHIFFSTYRTGYLYYLPFKSKTELLSEYVYPSDSLRAVLHHNYLFIITEDGLEYFLLRYHDSTHSSFIDNTLTPIDFGYSIALFLGLYQASPGSNSIHLLAKTTEADILRKRDASIGIKSEYSEEESSNIVGWSIYVMSLKDPSLILEEFYNLTKQSVENQSSFSHQMLFELYNYIYSSLLSFSSNTDKELIGKFTKVKKEVFTLLGDYYFQKNDYLISSHFFSYSDASINKTSRRFLEKSMDKSSPNTSNNQALHGLHNYLTKVLLDFKMIHLLDPEDSEFSDNLISVYHKHSPGILGQIILESYVTSYNLSNCLKLLVSARTQVKLSLQENIQNQEEGLYFASSKNEQHLWELTLALCFIYSLQEEFDIANDYLEILPDSFLISYISAHTNLLIPSSSLIKTYNPSNIGLTDSSLISPFNDDDNNYNPSSFAKCLAIYRPWILLEILVTLSKIIPSKFSEKCLDLTYDPNHFKMIYYETLLLDDLNIDYCVNLAELYISMILKKNDEKKITQNDDKTKLKHIYEDFHSNFLIDERYLWLDLIPPFKNYQNEHESKSYGVDNKYFHVQKLQGLICHSMSNKHIIHNINDIFKININSENNPIYSSIEILCLALTNGIEEPFRDLIKNYPSASLEFSKTFCANNEQWKVIWDILISEYKRDSNDELKDICTLFIDHLARIMDPLTFISLIPDDANSAFFLPYVELNLHCTGSKKIIKDMFKYSS